MEVKEDHMLILTGHYGCGKTSFAVSTAVKLRQAGCPVTLIDLDIVNPYFRSADFGGRLEKMGVRVVAPVYAGSNLDLPVLSAAVDSALTGGGQVILDVGGDDAGAVALGRYAGKIAQRPHTVLYLFNSCRYLTASPRACVQALREIEQAGRLRAHGLINNTNLGPETTAALVRGSLDFAKEVSRISGLPLMGTAAALPVASQLSDVEGLIELSELVRLPWEGTEREESGYAKGCH